MIILKYGDAKKLDESKRWKCRCSKCGCKVLLNKDDVQKYANAYDSDGHCYTSFYWECPYCETELYYEEYDDLFFRITAPILDKLLDFVLDHEGLCSVIIAPLIVGLALLVTNSVIDRWHKHNDETYNYKIQYDDNGTERVDWTNKIEEKNGYVIYINENDREKRQDLDTTVVIDLKEEDK